MTAEQTTENSSKVPGILSAYSARMRTIVGCALVHIPHAREIKKVRAREVFHELETKFKEAVASGAKPDQPIPLVLDRRLLLELDQQIHIGHADILAQSLLIFGFASLDAFIGTFLRVLYKEQPKLLHKIEEKEIKLADLLNRSSIEDVLTHMIDKDVSSMLRESYDEMFTKLAARHDISTLKKFDNWPKFVECAQRRNLITHCDGLVSSQYLSECKRADVKLPDSVVIGKKLGVSMEYLRSALEILYEVGVKLAHILWRNAAPERIWQSEKMLTDELYGLLCDENWGLAQTIGFFAVTLPRPQNDLQAKISRINYAQALKWGGNWAKGRAVLDEVEWSASIRDLRLGVEVLRENYDNAVKLMREIGKEGELIVKLGYRDWPVFREFRKTKQCADAFYEIYGEDLVPVDIPAVTVGRIPGEETKPAERIELQAQEQDTTLEKAAMPSEKPIIKD